VGVHLEAVPLGEVPEDARHRPTEDFDFFVVEKELPFVAAMRAELVSEVSVRTTLFEHLAPLGCLVFGNGL
jgi:hypothetical protein